MKTLRQLIQEIHVTLNVSSNLHETVLSASGKEADRHVGKYLSPHVGSNEFTHTTAKDHGDLKAGSKIKIHKVEKHADASGKSVYHAHVENEHGAKHIIPISKINKPSTGVHNKGLDFEKSFINHLKSHGLMHKDAHGAGSSGGTDFELINQRKRSVHLGRVNHGGSEHLNGETKADHSAAVGQLTIEHDPKKGGWHIPDHAREKRPKYAKAIEDAGIIKHMNQHHPEPSKSPITSSGRAKSIVMKHSDVKPAEAYLQDHHVDVLHVGGGKGTYSVGEKDKTGHGLPRISGKGEWKIRDKHRNANKRTVQFSFAGSHGLNPSHVNLENTEHIHSIKKTLGIK